MFNSTGNNFGAGVIQFKEAKESNYLVLNAKITCSTQSAAYQAAEVLEIYVPTLPFARSTDAGVVILFKHSEEYYGRTYLYDAGTVAKSWIKDEHTLCIEKLSVFDEHPEIIIYIQTLYCQLGQGANPIKGKQRQITAVSEDDYLYFSNSSTLCVLFDKWVFFHIMYSSCSYSMRSADWEAYLENMPEDVTADIPFIAAFNDRFTKLGCIMETHLEEGYWTLPANKRSYNIDNTGNYVFSFAYLVRDVVPEPVIEGRLRIVEEMLNGGQYINFYDFDLELIPAPAAAAVAGNTGIYSKREVTFTPKECPDEMPEFEAFFLDSFYSGKKRSIQLLRMQLTKSGSSAAIKITSYSNENNLAFIMNDTAIAMSL